MRRIGGLRIVATLAALLSFAAPPSMAQVQDQAAGERRLITTEGADYFGGDFDIMKDVDLDICGMACLGDEQCKAFTFNTATGWCFLKAEVGELRTVAGAISGKVAQAPRIDEASIAAREADLTFLPRQSVEEARRLRLELAGAERDPLVAGLDLPSLIANAQNALDDRRAIDAYREVLKRAPLDEAAWAGLTRSALDAKPTEYDEQREVARTSELGAINAYLTAGDDRMRAEALDMLGQSFEAASNWKSAIKSYRASLDLAEVPAVRARLDAVVASHGFRVVDNSVDNNAAAPRICLVFSDPLAQSLIQSDNVGDYLSVDGGDALPVTASGSQICVEGVKHGQRYHIVARPGIRSADGETLARPVDITVYVRDRDPSVRFATNAYVLPGGLDATIPVTTVNTDELKARVQRVGERSLSRSIGDAEFLRQLAEYQLDAITEERGETVWTGTIEVSSRTNEEVTTAIPVAELVKELQPGVYILSAQAVNGPQYLDTLATQWFVVSDIGLTTMGAENGFHVFARSLGSAEPLAGVSLDLVAVNNQILASATTDSDGHARFASGLLAGTGGNRPAVLTASRPMTGAREGDAEKTNGPAASDAPPPADFVFLDLTQSPFDLTDRGVDGRPPAGPVDVFLTAERGIYRTGETAHFTALLRDAKGEAVEGLALTRIVTRPDGVEFGREQVMDEGAGGLDFDVALPANAARGVWTVALHTDPKTPALARTTIIVEDFEPQKIAFDLSTDADRFDPASPPRVSVDARYLFGAPGAGLEVWGDAIVTASDAIAAYPGYRFGLVRDESNTMRYPFEGAVTDEAGHAEASLAAFEPPATTKPQTASLALRVIDPSGRPVERTLDLPMASRSARIGIKPRFEGSVPEAAEAGFDVVAIDADGARQALPGATWVLNRIETDFQWYNSAGRWNYEPVTTERRIASGEADLGAGDPLALSMPVEWGEYELVVTDPSGAAIPASVSFEAGWAIAATSLDTPDMARVRLDKSSYAVGDQAVVHIEPRFAGRAEILVMDERVVARRSGDIPAEGGDVVLDVTEDWGAGVYVTAIVYRPMDLAQKRMPGRAIGLAHASVDPGARKLDVAIEAPTTIEPRRSVPVEIAVSGVKPGETAYLTLAAVDSGILNITQFETPSPSAYYFGKRRLGVEIRDLYSKLIDRMQGAPGTVRSGGDAGGSYESPPPMDDLVSLFSGVVTLSPDGKARVDLDIPDFNGTLKLMAIAWSKTGVGEGDAEMVVRDPVVMAVSRPLFLAPGDMSRIAVDLTHVDGPTGDVTLSLSGGEGIVDLADGTDSGIISRTLSLTEGGRARVLLPVRADAIGDAEFDLSLALPEGGAVLTKRFGLNVRSNAPETVEKSRVALAGDGGSLTLDPDIFADYMPGTAAATVSITGATEFDVAGVVRALDRYPYGCTEQITSRAMPLVYLDTTILAAGLGRSEDLRARVTTAIKGVLANQSSNGAFGLWRPDSGDLWLDAYVTDFLTRAREAGYDVPNEAFTLALDNLRNNLSYLPDNPDFAPVAYAYYVLARNGRAAIGDLRYYSDNELSKFPALARGQIGAALALYGDRVRAERVFRSAIDASLAAIGPRSSFSDYGSALRDDAAILTLGLETKVDGLDLSDLVRRVNAGRQSQPYTSTQEDAWSLLAAHALLDRDPPRLSVSGRPVDGPYSASFDNAALSAGVDVANRSPAPITAEVTLRGVPKVAPPAATEGYQITRSAFTLEGDPADPSEVAQGDRLVFVVEVTPVDAGPARLMIDDPLPAGFEIDNPAILRGGDVAALDWLELSGEAANTEFRADRFLAAVDQGDGDTGVRRFAYIVRAVSPGEFVRPAALVQNMYDPSRWGRTEESRVSVVGPLR